MAFPFHIDLDTRGSGQQAAQDLSRSLEHWREKEDQRADKAKKIRGMAKMFADDLGLSKADVETKDAQELAGMVEGLMNENSPRFQKLKAEHESLAIDALKRQAETDAAQRRIPGALMEDVNRAGAGIPSPLNNEGYESELTKRTGLPPFVRNFIQAHAREGVPLPAGAMNEIMQRSGRADGPNAEMLARLGFVPSGGQLNPNGTTSITFGPPASPPPTAAVPIVTSTGQPTGKATFGEKVIDLSPPNSEGKTLTQSETQMLGALNQAEEDLANLENIFTRLGPDFGGPVSGRAKSAISMGQNPDLAAIDNAITAATPNLARGVFREVGVLTDEDIKRYKALLPTAYDTDAVRKVKMDQLRSRIKQGRTETMDMLRKAGRDLSGFEKPSSKSANVLKAELDVARAAIKRGKDPKAVRARYKERTGRDFPE